MAGSQTDTDTGAFESSPPPPPPAGVTPPPPPPTPPSLLPPNAASAGSAAVPKRAVPPPPPPAATPAAVRPPRPNTASRAAANGTAVAPADAAPATGVGTAKGVRWKGELQGIAEEQAEAEEEEEDLVEETLREAPSWLISLVIHLVVLLLLALLASPAGHRIGRVVLTLGPANEESNTDELSEFQMEDPMDSAVESYDDLPVDTPVELPDPSDMPMVELPDPEPMAAVDVPMLGGDIPIKPMVTGRSGAMKSALLAAYGGDATTVEAVDLALAWLKSQQRRDGSWSLTGPYIDGATSENKAAATAMALLAFQGDGNTHLSGKYAKEVERGTKFLIGQQDREGFFAGGTRVRHARAYAQAQATIAISELYAMTQDSWLREPAQKAVKYAERAQSSNGGWRYEPRNGADLSVTGWFVMALESARSGGLEVDPQVLYKTDEYLDLVQSYDGAAYAYQERGTASPTMTAEGLLCRQYLGWQRNHPPLVEAVETITSKYNFNIEEGNYYYWYYATQVLHHYGGQPWNRWNARMKVQLPAAQVRTGREAGSWSPQGSRWGSSGGRLYTTCLSVYCLEVYYRHLPLYALGQAPAQPPKEREPGPNDFVPGDL